MMVDSDSDSEPDTPLEKDELDMALDEMTAKETKRKISKLKGPKVRSVP